MQNQATPELQIEARAITLDDIACDVGHIFQLLDIALEAVCSLERPADDAGARNFNKVSALLWVATKNVKGCAGMLDDYIKLEVEEDSRPYKLQLYERNELSAVFKKYEQHRLAWEVSCNGNDLSEDHPDATAMDQMVKAIAIFPVYTESGRRKKAKLVLESNNLFQDIFESNDCSLRTDFLRTIAGE